jgi:hypothetical protein
MPTGAPTLEPTSVPTGDNYYRLDKQGGWEGAYYGDWVDEEAQKVEAQETITLEKEQAEMQAQDQGMVTAAFTSKAEKGKATADAMPSQTMYSAITAGVVLVGGLMYAKSRSQSSADIALERAVSAIEITPRSDLAIL